MSFLLFDYAVSAMKNAMYGFRPKVAVWQEPDPLSEKVKSCRSSNIAHVFSLSVPTKFLFSIFCSLDVNKRRRIQFLQAYGNQSLKNFS